MTLHECIALTRDVHMTYTIIGSPGDYTKIHNRLIKRKSPRIISKSGALTNKKYMDQVERGQDGARTRLSWRQKNLSLFPNINISKNAKRKKWKRKRITIYNEL